MPVAGPSRPSRPHAGKWLGGFPHELGEKFKKAALGKQLGIYDLDLFTLKLPGP